MSRKKPPFLSPEDKSLWDSFCKNVQKIKKVDRLSPTLPALSSKNQQQKKIFPCINTSKNFSVSFVSVKEFKAATIESRLDLHGFREAAAYEKLQEFLQQSYYQQLRWVLIITGKGSPKRPSILRKNVPKWLEALPTFVINYTTAPEKDGGNGAFYVKLRKKK